MEEIAVLLHYEYSNFDVVFVDKFLLLVACVDFVQVLFVQAGPEMFSQLLCMLP